MRSLTPTLLIVLATGAHAVQTDMPDVERGRMLYENHCVQCHTPGIHSRPNRLPVTRDEIAALVDHFRRTRNLGWTPQEIEDVVEYLNRTRYRYSR